MTRGVPALAAALALMAPAAAAAQSTTEITFDPEGVKRGSTLTVRASGETFTGRSPSTVSVLVQRGFKLEPKARARTCSDPANCPSASRIGAGRAVIEASGGFFPAGPQEFTAQLELFLAKPRRSGDRAGLVITYNEPQTGTSGALTGRVIRLASGPYGYELRVEGLEATAPSFPGLTARLKSLEFSAGAKRTVTVRKRGKRRRVTYHLITNPSRCDGAWENAVRATFPDGTTAERVFASPCSA